MQLHKFYTECDQGWWVQANEPEKKIGLLLGKDSRKANEGKSHGLGSSGDLPDDDPRNDVRGVMCELMVSKALNLYHQPSIGRHDIDVGGVIEARSAPNMRYHLVLKEWDKDLPTVCVVCHEEEQGRYLLAGWMHGWRIRQLYPLETRKSIRTGKDINPMHYVPLKDLWPMQHLLDMVTRKRFSGELTPNSIVAQYEQYNPVDIAVPLPKGVQVQIPLF